MNNEAEHLKLKLLQQLEQSKKLQQDNYTEAQEKLNASLTPILQNLENALAQVGIDELNKTLRTMTVESQTYRREFEDMSSDLRTWKRNANQFSQQISEAQDSLQSFQEQTAEHLSLVRQHSTLILEENEKLKQQIQAFEERLSIQDQQLKQLMSFGKHNNDFLADLHEKSKEAEAWNQRNENYLSYIMIGGGAALFLLFIILIGKF